LGEKQVPFSLIFTKSDKLSATKVSQNVEAFKQSMLETWEELPPIFVSSAVTKKGQTEILDYIDSIRNTTSLRA
jgi:GTP-binding protein